MAPRRRSLLLWILAVLLMLGTAVWQRRVDSGSASLPIRSPPVCLITFDIPASTPWPRSPNALPWGCLPHVPSLRFSKDVVFFSPVNPSLPVRLIHPKHEPPRPPTPFPTPPE